MTLYIGLRMFWYTELLSSCREIVKILFHRYYIKDWYVPTLCLLAYESMSQSIPALSTQHTAVDG
jgi:hypothetical protein